MDVKVRFLRPHKMVIEGREISFRESEIVELDQEIALRLFQEKVVLPGPSEGGIVENRFEL